MVLNHAKVFKNTSEINSHVSSWQKMTKNYQVNTGHIIHFIDYDEFGYQKHKIS